MWNFVLVECVPAMRDICLKTAAIVLQDITRIKQIIPANVMSNSYCSHNYSFWWHSLSILSPLIQLTCSQRWSEMRLRIPTSQCIDFICSHVITSRPIHCTNSDSCMHVGPPLPTHACYGGTVHVCTFNYVTTLCSTMCGQCGRVCQWRVFV